MEVMHLAHLRPDGIQIPLFVDYFTGIRVCTGFVESLECPQEIVCGLEARRFLRVRDRCVPCIRSAARKAKTLCEICLGVFQRGAQCGIAVFVTALGDPEPVFVGYPAELSKEEVRQFVIEMVRVVAVSGRRPPASALPGST